MSIWQVHSQRFAGARGGSRARALPGSDRTTWVDIDARIDNVLHARGGPDRRDLALAELLRTMAATIAAGRSVAHSIGESAGRIDGPVAAAAHRCGARLALGVPLDGALAEFAREVGTPSSRLLADVLCIRHRHGGSLSEVCHRLAGLLHDRVRLRAEARSATAQARFSAQAVLAVPIVLVVAGFILAPESVQRLVTPGMLLLSCPGLVAIGAGAMLVRSIARRSQQLDVAPSPHARRRLFGALLDRIGGEGPRSRRSARLVVAAGAAGLPLVLTGPSTMMLGAMVLVIGCAAARPWTDRHVAVRDRHRVVAHGIDTLLEVSIAMLAAGATIPEVVRGAVAATPVPLRSVLQPAADLAALGQVPHLAFAGIPEVAESPELGAWIHALRTGSELGAPAISVLETVLRDVRSQQRERIRRSAATAGPRIQLATVLLVVPGVMWLMLLATVSGLVQQLSAAGIA